MSTSMQPVRRRHRGDGCKFVLASISCNANASPQSNAPQSLTFQDGMAGVGQVLSDLQQKASSALPFKGSEVKPAPPWLGRLQAMTPKNKNVLSHTAVPDESGPLVCIEMTHGRKRVYKKRGGDVWEGWDMVEAAQTTQGRLMNLLKSYILPQGFPDSVAPQYASYMGWRGVQYFFGGAISVYTTKSLLGALGVAGKFSGEAAAAINWVIKDGAGRLGRLLFARWGRELDCELKQFRLAGDLLMEGGAALELATIWAPQAFLPLACTANLAKNLAAVAASATRAPIYRTFALQNNLADITAKGESVANLADILGTVAGIMLSKVQGLPMLPTFCVLSTGYLLASRREVDSVELPYLNRARLGYVARAYLEQGHVPGVAEANHKEPLLPGQGFNNGRIILGSNMEAACQGITDLKEALGSLHHHHNHQRFIITYRSDQRKVHVLLKEGATSMDCLKASFVSHLFLYCLEGHTISASLPSVSNYPAETVGPHTTSSGSELHGLQLVGGWLSERLSGLTGHKGSQEHAPPQPHWRATMARVSKLSDALYPEFIKQAEKQGWKLNQTMLNPKDTRLLKLCTPLQL